MPPAGFVSLACSIPDGLIDGGPFSPFSRAISARRNLGTQRRYLRQRLLKQPLEVLERLTLNIGGEPDMHRVNHSPQRRETHRATPESTRRTPGYAPLTKPRNL